MSGGYGSPRKGRVKVKLRIQKAGTRQKFSTFIFLPFIHSLSDIYDKMQAKYPDLYGDGVLPAWKIVRISKVASGGR